MLADMTGKNSPHTPVVVWQHMRGARKLMGENMVKLKLTGQNLGQVFNSRLGHACICRAMAYITKQPNLNLKTWPKHLLGSLPLAFALPGENLKLVWAEFSTNS